MIKPHSEGAVLSVKLTPKASKNALTRVEADVNGKSLLRASVTTVPENGKANAALIKLLSKKLGLPKTSIRLIAGEQSRYKTVLFEGEPGELILALSDKLRGLGLTN